MTGAAGRSAPTALPPGEGRGVIAIDGLTRRFGVRLAVHPIRLTIGPGGVTGLLGPNGSGKSTLLRLLLGLVRPDAGHARLDGLPLRGDGTAVRRRATYMPGELAVYGELTGLRHLRWFAEGRERGALERSVQLARRLELPLERRVRGYSHGMKRQLLFAAAMGPDVPLCILDEPTEGLDPTKRSAVLEHLRAEARRGRTVLLSSHHLGEVERACDRVLFMKEGRLIDEDEARRIRQRAGRLVRLRFASPVEERHLARELAAEGLTLLRAEPHELSVLLSEGAPRASLARLLALRGLPEPSALSFGELSLHELYRELYGAEGV